MEQKPADTLYERLADPMCVAEKSYQEREEGDIFQLADSLENLRGHQLIEQRAKRAPDTLALQSAEHHLTYHVLNGRANQVAHYLQKIGISEETLVGIYLPLLPESIIGMLGVLKAGAAYFPLDPDTPLERLIFLLQDAGVKVVITQERLAADILRSMFSVICMDADWHKIAQCSREQPENTITAGNLAYIIYTSGSTGQPKGVQIEHRGLTNLLCWHRQTFAVLPEDRAVTVASFSFDASVWGLWSYLAAGASVHIVPDLDTRLQVEQLGRWMESEAITIAFLPTTLAERALTLRWSSHARLRILLTGGDRLRRYPDPAAPFTLVNNYGPTESTVVATSGVVLPQREEALDAPLIGQPIMNTQIYILDERGQPVPVGQSGELYISGIGLARCYLNRPEQTAERFLPDPFSGRPGARLYRTGDIGRWTPEGAIDFLGRVDDQIKIRGFRVEPGEVEVALASQPAVRTCAVVVTDDGGTGASLIAFVVPRAGQGSIVRTVRSALAEKLPDYMLPDRIVEVEELLFTDHGKIDRQALLEVYGTGLKTPAAGTAPRTGTEQQLVRVWSELLEVDQCSRHDTFFELGGHSLSALQLLLHVRELFAVNFSLRNLYEAPTLEQMAAAIDAARRRE